jgi:hypothetical protein
VCCLEGTYLVHALRMDRNDSVHHYESYALLSPVTVFSILVSVLRFVFQIISGLCFAVLIFVTTCSNNQHSNAAGGKQENRQNSADTFIYCSLERSSKQSSLESEMCVFM